MELPIRFRSELFEYTLLMGFDNYVIVRRFLHDMTIKDETVYKTYPEAKEAFENSHQVWQTGELPMKLKPPFRAMVVFNDDEWLVEDADGSLHMVMKCGTGYYYCDCSEFATEIGLCTHVYQAHKIATSYWYKKTKECEL